MSIPSSITHIFDYRCFQLPSPNAFHTGPIFYSCTMNLCLSLLCSPIPFKFPPIDPRNSSTQSTSHPKYSALQSIWAGITSIVVEAAPNATPVRSRKQDCKVRAHWDWQVPYVAGSAFVTGRTMSVRKVTSVVINESNAILNRRGGDNSEAERW